MEELAQNILKSAARSGKVQTEFSFWENVQGFYHAVDWTEPWIIGIGVLHVVLYVAVIALRKSSNFQFTSFVAISALVFYAETFNTWAAANWQSFATQDYFDKHGVFVSAIFSAPLLLLIFTQLLMAVKRSMDLVVQVKRLELAAKQRQATSGAASGDTADAAERVADATATSGGASSAALGESSSDAAADGVRRRATAGAPSVSD